VHNKVSAGNAFINFFDAVNSEDIASRWATKLIGAMAGAKGDSQCVTMRLGDEICRFFWVREHLIMGEDTLCANAIFFTGLPCF
jgi:hypothetical protein